MDPIRKRRTGKEWTVLVLRIVLGLIMLYAAVPKFFNWEGISWASPIPPVDLAPFARSVYNYRVIPIPLVNLAAMFIPPIEGLCAIFLLSGLWLRTSTLILGFFQTAFLAGMVQAMIRGLDIDCGCFVGADSKVGYFSIIRDSFFLIGFITVFVMAKEEAVVSKEAPQPHQIPT